MIIPPKILALEDLIELSRNSFDRAVKRVQLINIFNMGRVKRDTYSLCFALRC